MDEVVEMSERERALAEAIGRHVVARLLEAAQNPEVTTHVVDNWTGQIQRAVGRAVLRVVFYIIGVALLVQAFNECAMHWLQGLFK